MNELVKTIDELYAAFKTDAELQAGKNNKAAGLRARKVSLELEKKLKDLKAELFNLRFQLAINQLDNPMRISAVKKDIARVKTVLRQMELNDSAKA